MITTTQISRANVVQCILEMLIAGTDTSSVSLFYTLVCLADSEQWEDAVWREVSQATIVQDEVTSRSSSKMPYLF